MERKNYPQVSVGFIHYPVTTLGYGNRIGIWFAGCNRRCDGCQTSLLWEFDYSVDGERVLAYVESKFALGADGITISGGEPFEQIEFLSDIIDLAKKHTDDILVYTGYKIDELKRRAINTNIIKKIGVLIDGEYKKEYDDGKSLRGSSNQKVIILNEKLRERYEKVQKELRETELVSVRGKLFSIGINKGAEK